MRAVLTPLVPNGWEKKDACRSGKDVRESARRTASEKVRSLLAAFEQGAERRY